MKPFNEESPELHHGISDGESSPEDWVPNLAERLETLERANLALERARVLLENFGNREFELTN